MDHEGMTQLRLRIPKGLSEENLQEMLASLTPELASMVRDAEQEEYGLTVVAHPGNPHECPICREDIASLEGNKR